ncbi:uncharacterized protein TNCT_140411 [Trichonephila clavata]|uniref:Uncharacterized protein n=1 Tax=Trichonephila clavata TaxID=2740835 RepID=A0A8X6F4Z0_TRICU|nr:uncharacterized protein TNCT_140411 [Trichonephila clavata]
MTSIIEPGSLVSENSDQSVIMEDISASPTLTDQDRCNSLRGFEKQHHIFDARKDYVVSMLDIEKKIPSPTDETKTKLEDELKGLDVKLKFLQGKMNEFLPCPIALCTHNYKFKALKRAAEPILRPGKLTAVVNKNLKTKKINIENGDFSFPKKTARPVPVENKTNQINTTNSFAVLNTAKSDAEDVTLPQSKIKPIMMRMTSSYNLILQSINRTHPTAINTHINGFIKIAAETEEHHREITQFLTSKQIQYYGKGKSTKENKARNENSQATQSLTVPGFSFAQAATPKESHQMAPRGNVPSASATTQNLNLNANNNNLNPENINANQSNNGEFGFLQAILEIQNIFKLFPDLLSEMKKSFNNPNPADKLGHLLKGVCSSISNITINDV